MMINKKLLPVVIVMSARLGLSMVNAGDFNPGKLAEQSAKQLLAQAREAYTIVVRIPLSQALAAKGMNVLSDLDEALSHHHWHVRHCSLMALRELAGKPQNRSAIATLLPKISERLLDDPALGVRIAAAECIHALGEHGNDAQHILAQASLNDPESWVRDATSSALTAVNASHDVMIPVYKNMIRSADRDARREGIAKARQLYDQGANISALVPALKDVFRKPQYDANFSRQTRVPAMALLLRMGVDTRGLVPYIVKDMRTAWQLTEDGYHPYQKITLSLLGRMGAAAEDAIPVLEEVIADPTQFGCAPRHPDYKNFISLSQEAISKIRADLENKENAQ